MEEIGGIMYDIIIVGAGPAGLTSALYALRANKKILVLEAKSYGGQIINASKIENYPGILEISGFEFASNLYHQVVKLGGEIRFETVLRVEKDKTVVTHKNQYKAKAVILATGAENRKLQLDREQEFVGKGISYCATCDGNFYKNKVVAVNGGGNTALEDAIYLSNVASKVYVIHRRDQFRGEEKYVKELQDKENVVFLLNTTIIALDGKDRLEAIILKEQEKEQRRLPVDGLFIAIGQIPKNEIFSNVVDLDESGYIISFDEIHTKTEGIYVAGDTRAKVLRQLTTAISDGSLAATVAIEELQK